MGIVCKSHLQYLAILIPPKLNTCRMEDSSFKGKDAQYIQGLKKKNEKTIEARPLDATRIPADCKLVAIANEVSRNQGCHR